MIAARRVRDDRRFVLGGIGIDRVTMAGALDAIERLVDAGRGGMVFTPNVDHVVIADRDPAFRAAYRDADVALPDGMPLLWAARLLGEPLPEKVSGSDLVLPLAARAAARGWRVYLLGGAPGVAAEAAARLRSRFPGIGIAGTDAPRIEPGTGPDETAAALARVREAGPQLLLVALGAPKQEVWIHRHLEQLRPAVAVGVGASLDFVAGRRRRAPRWISRAGLEWLWRLSLEPRRLWRRYLLEDPRFATILLRELRGRSKGRGAA